MKNVTKGYNFATGFFVYTFRMKLEDQPEFLKVFRGKDVNVEHPRGEVVKVYTKEEIDSLFEENGFTVLKLRN